VSLSFLLRQSTRGQVIAKNTVWLGVTSGISGLGDFVLTVYVIRTFGASAYGVFGYAFSFVSLFGALFDVGLATAVTREVAADRARERDFGDLLVLKALISAVGIGIVWLAGLAVTADPLARRMIVLLACYAALMELASVFYALFRARQKMEVEAAFRLIYIGCLAALIVGLVSLHHSVLSVGVAYLGAIAVTVACAGAFLLRSGGLRLSWRPRLNVPVWRAYLAIGLYVAFLRVAGDLNTNIGPVTLGYLGRFAQIGWYNAADKIYGVLLFPMALVSAAIFPALAEAKRSSPDRFARLWTEWARVTIVLSVMLGVLVFVKAQDLIAILYPGNFGPAVLAVRILVVAAFITYLQSPYYNILLVADRQRPLFTAGAVATAAHVVLNFVLVPPFGLYGVALGTVLSQLLMFGQCVALTRRYAAVTPVYSELARACVVAAASAIVMAAALLAAPHGRMGLLVAVPFGVLAYVAVVAVFARAWPSGARR